MVDENDKAVRAEALAALRTFGLDATVLSELEMGRMDLKSELVTDTTLRTLREIGLLHALQKGNAIKSDDELKTLNLSSTSVTDAGLKELAGLRHLTSLSLNETKVTDVGMKEVGGLKSLQEIGLFDTKVTGAGLKELAGLKNLSSLYLKEDQITDMTLRSLREIGLLYVIMQARGKTIGVRPKSPDDIVSLMLSETKVTDEGLKEVTGLKNLKLLWLKNEQITDAALRTLRENGLLHTLVGKMQKQGGAPMSADDIEAVYLNNTRVTDNGLKELAGLNNLTELFLDFNTQVTDGGLKELAGMKNLQKLSLFSTKVTDVGLKELVGLTNLQELNVGLTKVTDAGVRQLQMALPKAKIHK